MLNDIFKYYALTEYQHMIVNINLIPKNYKIYDSRFHDTINYIIYDISSHCVGKDNTIIDTIHYIDNLEFTFDQSSKVLYINKLPQIEYNFDKFMVFTSDILEIIKSVLQTFISLEDIEIVFPPILIFAYSTNVEDYIKENENLRLINNILTRTDRVKQSLQQKIYNDKKKTKIREEKVKKVIDKRKEIFGIKKEDFKDMEKYKDALNKKTVAYAQREYERYSRHVNICFKKYTDYLKDAFDKDKDYADECLLSLCDEDDMNYGWDYKSPQCKEKFLNKIANKEIEDICAQKKESDLDKMSITTSYEYTTQLANSLTGEYQYHPIYAGTDEKTIFKMINLAIYINDLRLKLQYHQEIINCDDAYMEFKKDNIIWGSILELPYFFKFAYSRYWGTNGEIINALIMKPGITNIDLNHLFCFGTYKKEGFGKYNNNYENPYEYHQKIIKEFKKNKNYVASRLIITIPKSLNETEIQKIINFGIQNGHHINFICEALDVALVVKKYIIFEELQQQKKQKSFLCNNGHIFVNIDPTYYQTYFTNLPSNKSLFHMYDYGSNYKYRRKDMYSLTSLIAICLQQNQQKNQGAINFEEVEEQLLGSYHTLKYENLYIHPNLGASTFDALWDMNFSFIQKYIEEIPTEVEDIDAKKVYNESDDTLEDTLFYVDDEYGDYFKNLEKTLIKLKERN